MERTCPADATQEERREVEPSADAVRAFLRIIAREIVPELKSRQRKSREAHEKGARSR